MTRIVKAKRIAEVLVQIDTKNKAVLNLPKNFDAHRLKEWRRTNDEEYTAFKKEVVELNKIITSIENEEFEEGEKDEQ